MTESPTEQSAKPQATEPDATSLAAERQQKIVAHLQAIARQRGQTIFDGQWIQPDQVTRHYRRLWWRSVLIIAELLVLFAALTAVAGVVGLVLATLLGEKL